MSAGPRCTAGAAGAAVALAALAAVAPAGLAAPSSTITMRDARGDARTNLDVQRASLKLVDRRSRLEASITFAAEVRAKDLLAATDRSPGAVCLRFWPDPGADPAATQPDRLVCVTA